LLETPASDSCSECRSIFVDRKTTAGAKRFRDATKFRLGVWPEQDRYREE
jgi:hypothetical protein